jgi:predicted HTH domain antitoxin
MSAITLEIPGEVTEALRLPPDESRQRLHRELALRLYQKGILAFGMARQLAGMTKWDFHFLLAEEDIVRHYDKVELDEDLKVVSSWE